MTSNSQSNTINEVVVTSRRGYNFPLALAYYGYDSNVKGFETVTYSGPSSINAAPVVSGEIRRHDTYCSRRTFM